MYCTTMAYTKVCQFSSKMQAATEVADRGSPPVFSTIPCAINRWQSENPAGSAMDYWPLPVYNALGITKTRFLQHCTDVGASADIWAWPIQVRFSYVAFIKQWVWRLKILPPTPTIFIVTVVDVRLLQRVVSAIVQCRPGLQEEEEHDGITPILPHVTGELRPPKSACSFFENAFTPDNNREEVIHQFHDHPTMQKGLSSLHRRQMWDGLVNFLQCARVSLFEKSLVWPTLAQCLQYVTGPVVLNFLVGLAQKSVVNT